MIEKRFWLLVLAIIFFSTKAFSQTKFIKREVLADLRDTLRRIQNAERERALRRAMERRLIEEVASKQAGFLLRKDREFLKLSSESGVFADAYGLEFRNIPAGYYHVDPDRVEGEIEEGLVEIEESFWVSRHEVTVGEIRRWRALSSTTPRDPLSKVELDAGGPRTAASGLSLSEVETIIKFLNSRSRKIGGLPTNLSYRLLTSLEWVAACHGRPKKGLGESTDNPLSLRGGDSRVRVIRSNHSLLEGGSELISEMAWTFENSGGRVRKVGMLLPNFFGLYDMIGNVSEWTSSVDPMTPPEYSMAIRDYVVRGGGVQSSAKRLMRSTGRAVPPGGDGSPIGIRLAISK